MEETVTSRMHAKIHILLHCEHTFMFAVVFFFIKQQSSTFEGSSLMNDRKCLEAVRNGSQRARDKQIGRGQTQHG